MVILGGSLTGGFAGDAKQPARDVETLPEGATFNDVKGAHEADVKTQERYGVAYLRYWVDESNGKVFCLVDAPNAEAATTVHREAHGLVADEIYAVREGS